MELLAQLPESWVTGLAQAGVLGIIIGILFIRDFMRDRHDHEREKKRDEQMERLTAALHNLIRITSIEVLTRPNVVDRVQEEVRELHRASSPTTK